MFITQTQKLRAPLLIFLFLVTMATVSCDSTPEPARKKTLEVPPGWYLSIHNTQVKVIKAIEDKEKYSIKIDRQNDLVDADYYLRIAESVFPKQEKIFKKETLETKQWYFERPWWFDKHENVPVPFALTADTINYYLERYRNLKDHIKGKTDFEEFKKKELKRIELEYTAKVTEEGSVIAEGKYLPKIRVKFYMKWYEYCEQPCGWGFEKKREVTFAGKYKILSISGDKPAKVWISNERTPYGPNEWIKF